MEKTQNKRNIKHWIITAVIALVVGCASFFAGTKYPRTNATFTGRFGNAAQMGNRGPRGNNFTPVVGQIISVDAKSITVKLTDGSSKIVLLSTSTTINKASTGTKEDLSKDTQVAIFGTSNSDGSVTANNIQINPEMGRGFGRGTEASPMP